MHLPVGTLFLFVVAAACVGQTLRDDTAIEREIQSGTAALRQGRYAEAEDHFLQADKLAGAPSAEINAGIAMSELQMGTLRSHVKGRRRCWKWFPATMPAPKRTTS